MSNVAKINLTIGLVLCCFVVGQAQETAATCSTSSIYGRVISSDSRIPAGKSWIVQVTAKRRGRDAVLDSEESQGELFCVKVPLFSIAELVFERDGFDPGNTDPIDTNKQRNKHSYAVPVIIKLDPIHFNGRSDAQRREELRQEIRAKLNKHKEALSATGSNDIFTWNLELYRNIYRNRPDALKEIDTFQAELKQLPQFLFLSTSEFENKSKLFKFMIARSSGQYVERDVKAADITALVNDTRVLSSIRLEAISILDSLYADLSTLERTQASVALTKALEKDPSSNVRAQSATALTKIGDANALETLQTASTDDESSKVRTAANAALLAIRARPEPSAPIMVRQTVQNPDGTYAIIEYPVRKEVTVNLTSINVTGAKGVATILRDDDGTKIKLNLTDVPADLTALTLYAVDDKGIVTALGPVAISNGTGTLAATTPLSRFMLVASPEPALTAYDANTKVLFRSAVPEGMAVIPLTSAEGDKVMAVTAPTAKTTTTTTPGAVVSSPSGTTVVVPMTETKTTYTAPLLNIPAYKKGDDTKIKVDFTGAMTGARANVFLTPRKDGPTEVNMRFHDLKEAPAGQKFIVWAVSPDMKFIKLGEILNTGGRNEAEIKSEVALPDFGLVVTMESADADLPAGPAVGTIHIVP
jgi:HEAT repeats